MLRPSYIAADQKLLDKLIAQLDNSLFEVREKASQELENEHVAELSLRKALSAQQPSLEVRRRLERLVEKLEGPVTSPETLRALRALEVLEHIGTAEARQVLAGLAQGAPAAHLTEEAKASLDRLGKRPHPTP